MFGQIEREPTKVCFEPEVVKLTLGSEINVGSRINVGVGRFGKKNKRRVWNNSRGGKFFFGALKK